MRMLDERKDNDVEVSWSDQQSINAFSRLNNALGDVEERIAELQRQAEALDDLAMELELVDEEEMVLYKVGDAFLHLAQPEALQRLEADTAANKLERDKFREKAEECERRMRELKVKLYAKFGDNINLERE